LASQDFSQTLSRFSSFFSLPCPLPLLHDERSLSFKMNSSPSMESHRLTSDAPQTASNLDVSTPRIMHLASSRNVSALAIWRAFRRGELSQAAVLQHLETLSTLCKAEEGAATMPDKVIQIKDARESILSAGG